MFALVPPLAVSRFHEGQQAVHSCDRIPRPGARTHYFTGLQVWLGWLCWMGKYPLGPALFSGDCSSLCFYFVTLNVCQPLFNWHAMPGFFLEHVASGEGVFTMCGFILQR